MWWNALIMYKENYTLRRKMDFGHNFTILIILLFVLDSFVCCSCALNYPKKFYFIPFDSWWLGATFISCDFSLNIHPLVKLPLNFLMLFSRYSCFWKNGVVLLQIAVECFRNELEGLFQAHLIYFSPLYPNILRYHFLFFQLRAWFF